MYLKLNVSGILMGLMISALAIAEENNTALRRTFFSLVGKIETSLIDFNRQEKSIDQLANGSLRSHLFSLQSLADRFSTKYPPLREAWSSSKRLEDEIGAYRFTREHLENVINGGADEGTVARARERVSSQREYLQRFLRESRWEDAENGELANIKRRLGSINWDSNAKEQAYVFKAIADNIKRIAETDWKMDRVEGGGVHDLRKAARFYLKDVQALEAFIGVNRKSCTDHPVTPADPYSGGRCLIPICMHDTFVRIDQVFSDVKDRGEMLEANGKEITPEDLKPAAELYAHARRHHSFEELENAYRSCAEEAQ